MMHYACDDIDRAEAARSREFKLAILVSRAGQIANSLRESADMVEGADPDDLLAAADGLRQAAADVHRLALDIEYQREACRRG